MIKSKKLSKYYIYKGKDEYLWDGMGGKISLYNPKPENFHIEAIASSLSKICRYSGGTKRFYSVAEHSVYVSRLCPPHLKLHGALHDASEFRLNDLVKNLKQIPAIAKIYKPLEEKWMKAIAKRFGFIYNKQTKAQIKEIETAVELAELRDLIILPSDENRDLSYAMPIKLHKTMSPERAERFFLDEFHNIISLYHS